jgi:ADP-heptose:LPS heptosyltransferase
MCNSNRRPKKIGVKNTFIHPDWNKVSDAFYTELYFNDTGIMMHEFFYNQEFTNWCCGTHLAYYHPRIATISANSLKDKYIVCFVGSSTPSKRWPSVNWIQLIRLCKQNNMPPIIIVGGKTDIEMANFIQKETNTPNTAGKTSLIKTLYQIANAAVIITNDTMAAHAAASFSKPAIIIANGNNYYRFTNYKQPDIYTIYPKIFLSRLQKRNSHLLHYTAVTRDIASIKAGTVFNALKAIIAKAENNPFLETIIPENI